MKAAVLHAAGDLRIEDRAAPVAGPREVLVEIADRIHIHRLGKRVAVVDPKEHSMHEVVGIMTGAVVHDIEHQEGQKKNGGGTATDAEKGTPAA